jgi:hypothetical protein
MPDVMERRQPGRPRRDTQPTGVMRECRRCGRTQDRAAWSPAYRQLPTTPCRDCAIAYARRWAAKHPERVLANRRAWRQRHRPPRPPIPRCGPGHRPVWSKANARWRCDSCLAERQRERGKEQWRQLKADPQRLAAKRARGAEWARAKTARRAAQRPPTPSRRQPDGTWTCIGCGQAKAPDDFYTSKSSGLPEGRCRACCRARRRELSAAHQAEDGPAAASAPPGRPPG